MTGVLAQVVLAAVFGTAGVGIVVGKGALFQWSARGFNKISLQRIRCLIGLGECGSYGFRHKNSAERVLPTAAQGELTALADVPCQELGDTLWVGSGWCHIVAPEQSGSSGDSIVCRLISGAHMVRLPPDALAGSLVLDHAPRHGIAEGTHAVLLDVIAAEVHQREVHETSDGYVCRLIDLPLSAVNTQLSRHRSVEPAEWYPGMSRGQCAAKVRTAQGFRQGDENGHQFGLATSHHTVHGYVPCRCVAMGYG